MPTHHETAAWTRRAGGTTLVSLLTVMAILAVLVTAGIPSFRSLINQHAVWVVQHDLTTGIQLARQTAVSTGNVAVICGTRTGASCEAQAWSDGWIIFRSPSGATDCNVQPDGRCHHGGVVDRIELFPGNRARVLANRNILRRIRFDALGASRFSNGTFTVCDRDGIARRQLVLSNVGRLRTTEPAPASDCGK